MYRRSISAIVFAFCIFFSFISCDRGGNKADFPEDRVKHSFTFGFISRPSENHTCTRATYLPGNGHNPATLPDDYDESNFPELYDTDFGDKASARADKYLNCNLFSINSIRFVQKHDVSHFRYEEIASAMSIVDYRAICRLYMVFYLMESETDRPKPSFVLGFDKPDFRSLAFYSTPSYEAGLNNETKITTSELENLMTGLSIGDQRENLLSMKAYLPGGNTLDDAAHSLIHQNKIFYCSVLTSLSNKLLNKLLYDHVNGKENGFVRIEMYANLPFDAQFIGEILDKPLGDESIAKHWFDLSSMNVMLSQKYFHDASGSFKVDDAYVNYVKGKPESVSQSFDYSLLFANSIHGPMPYTGVLSKKNSDLKSEFASNFPKISRWEDPGLIRPSVSRIRLCFMTPDPSSVGDAVFYRAPKSFDAGDYSSADCKWFDNGDLNYLSPGLLKNYAYLYNLWITHSAKGVFLGDYEATKIMNDATSMFPDLPEGEVDKAIDLVEPILPSDYGYHARIRPIESRYVDVYLYSYSLKEGVPNPSILLNIPFKTKEGVFIGRNFYEIILPSELKRNYQYTYYVKPYSLGSTSWKSPVKLDIPLLVRPWVEGKSKDVNIH